MGDDVRKPASGGPAAWAATHSGGHESVTLSGGSSGVEHTLPTSASSAVVEVGVEQGDRVGRFVVIGELGAGGMGVVYAAYDPELDRKVAVKLLRVRHGDEDGRVRALREAQAMARLTHTNVVTIYEVGRHDDQIYLAMELVEGCTLRDWLRAAPRTWRQVVAVMAQAGRGLAAAHEAGLVHRDIKPSNILVDARGRACVTDFGISNAAGAASQAPVESADGALDESQELAELRSHSALGTPLTRTGALLGTPAYMAPEQLKGTSNFLSDQYSFCVTFYEALFGKRPYQGLDSVRIPKWLRRLVLRGLSDDPPKRYPSMESLVAHLDRDRGQWRRPVLASGLVAGLAIVAQLAMGSREAERCQSASALVDQLWSAEQARLVLEAFLQTKRPYAEDTYQRVSRHLSGYAESWASMRAQSCRATLIDETQDYRAYRLRNACLDRRRAEMNALTAIFGKGADVEVLDRSVQASVSLVPIDGCADVDALAAETPLPEDPTARALVEALEQELVDAEALRSAGKYNDALPLAGQLAERSLALDYLPIRARALSLLGDLQRETGDAKSAEATCEDLVRVSADGAQDDLVAEGWACLLQVVGVDRDQYDRALSWRLAAESAVARAKSQKRRAQLDSALGLILYRQGKYEQAAELQEQALAIQREVLGPGHPTVARTLNNLGVLFFQQGNNPRAIEYHERALAIWEAALGPEHPSVAHALNDLGIVRKASGQYQLAVEHYQRALKIWRATFGPEHPHIASALNNLALAESQLGKHDDAIEHFEQALAIWRATLGPEHQNIANGTYNLGLVFMRLHKYDQALEYYRKALSILQASLAPDHPRVAIAFHGLAQALAEAGDHQQAMEYFRRALAIQEKSLRPGHPHIASSLLGISEALLALRKPAQAVPLLERALSIEMAGDGDPEQRSDVQFALARALQSSGGNHARAQTLAAEARRSLQATTEPSAEKLAAIDEWLASHAP